MNVAAIQFIEIASAAPLHLARVARQHSGLAKLRSGGLLRCEISSRLTAALGHKPAGLG